MMYKLIIGGFKQNMYASCVQGDNDQNIYS